MRLLPWYRTVEEPFRARLVVTSATRERPSTVDLLLADRVTFARPDSDGGETTNVDVTFTTVEELGAARREQRRSADAPRGGRRDVAAFRAASSL